MSLVARAWIPVVLAKGGCSFNAPATVGGDGTVTIDGASDDAATGGGDAGGGGGDASIPDAGTAPDGTPDAISLTPDAPPLPDAATQRACQRSGSGYAAVANGAAGTTYKAYGGMAWTVARTRCETDQAYLAIPDSNSEARAIYAAVSPQSASPYAWVGVSDADDNQVWTTVLGATFTVSPWGPMQPTNNGSQLYLLIDSMGRFYDYDGGAAQEFACECAP